MDCDGTIRVVSSAAGTILMASSIWAVVVSQCIIGAKNFAVVN